MHKKTLLFTLSLLFVLAFSGIAHAESEYDIVAGNFLSFLGSDKTITYIESIESNEFDPSQPPVAIGHIAYLKGGGYILISASQSLTPIKAYSLDRYFEDLPDQYRKFILSELEYNTRTLKAAKTPQSAAATENQQRWGFLLRFEKTTAPLEYKSDTYLLTAKWNQGYPYNKFLPQIDGKNVLAGCVNIAVAQLMKYYSYPSSGKGVNSYTWNGEQLKTILYREFNWENMPDTLDATTPEYKADEVALLIRDLGIINRTSFGLSNSGASANRDGLIEHFGFSNTIQSMDNTDVDAFFNKLKSEINEMRPVLLEFPGHLTVADGYSSDPSGRKIHVNMGWGGTANDYYYLDQTVNAGSYAFSPDLSILYNVKPCSGNDCYVNLEPGDTLSGNTISGKFDMTKDTDKYTAYLKGDTSISASRGYSNVAFFVSIYNDSTNALVYTLIKNAAAGSQVFAGNLPAGKYTIRISLCDDTCSSSYTYGDYSQYTVSFSTGNLSDSEKTAIDSALDYAPAIGNTFKDIALNTSATDPFKILIDARDENGDTAVINIVNSNNNAVQAALTKNILSITPVPSASKSSGKITVQVTANGKTAEKSFIFMVLNEDISFGKNFEVKGIFDNQDDVNTRKVILDGQCRITGYNGFSNQGFYGSVKDISGDPVVLPVANEISHSFQRNVYLLSASLRNGGSYYPYQSGTGDKYTLTVSCPGADETVTTIAGMLGVDLSGIADSASKIELSAGWNFISFPKEPSPNNTIAEALKEVSSNVRIIWGYDNQSNVWLKYRGQGAGVMGQNVLTTIEAGKGYWFYMDGAASINMTAWLSPSAAISLHTGWNLVGYNGTDGAAIDTAIPTFLAGKWIIVWNWENGQWSAKHATITNLPIQPLTVFNRKKAYWIRMGEGAEW